VIQTVQVKAPRRGLNEITSAIQRAVAASGIREGLATVFIQHTSASLVIQENADPAVAHDLQRFLERLAPENDPAYTHVQEGPDDMPAHIRAALTAVSLAIPVVEGRLALGTWQGLYLWEHRRTPGNRSVLVHVAP
jgi:secondary thiamine-phosphate synthase enzyme